VGDGGRGAEQRGRRPGEQQDEDEGAGAMAKAVQGRLLGGGILSAAGGRVVNVV
jgi:hypothetical protein